MMVICYSQNYSVQNIGQSDLISGFQGHFTRTYLDNKQEFLGSNSYYLYPDNS